jgi:hypothetical protein
MVCMKMCAACECCLTHVMYVDMCNRRGMKRLKRYVKIVLVEREDLADKARKCLQHWRAVICVLPTPLQTGAQAFSLHKWIALTIAPLGPSYPWSLENHRNSAVAARVRRYLRGTLKLSKRRKRLLEHATALSDVFALRVVFATWRQLHAILVAARHACRRSQCRLALHEWHSWARKRARLCRAANRLSALLCADLQLWAFRTWAAAKIDREQCELAEVWMWLRLPRARTPAPQCCC